MKYWWLSNWHFNKKKSTSQRNEICVLINLRAVRKHNCRRRNQLLNPQKLKVWLEMEKWHRIGQQFAIHRENEFQVHQLIGELCAWNSQIEISGDICRSRSIQRRCNLIARWPAERVFWAVNSSEWNVWVILRKTLVLIVIEFGVESAPTNELQLMLWTWLDCVVGFSALLFRAREWFIEAHSKFMWKKGQMWFSKLSARLFNKAD